MITIVRRMPKHKSVLREQAQQINFKSVLNCQNTFKSVFNLLGLFVQTHFWIEIFQRYIQKSFLVLIGDFKKIWNRAKIFFWCALSIAPPFFPNPVSSCSTSRVVWIKTYFCQPLITRVESRGYGMSPPPTTH